MAASQEQTSRQRRVRQYPAEFRERALRMVEETIKETGQEYGAVPRVAKQLGLGPETVRYWIKQAELASRPRPEISREDKQRIADLEQEVRELRRANEILKAASAFFARELDPRLPK